jgi:hypothetical protein
MWLPQELAVQIGSYLDPRDLWVCTTQLCSSGAEFVANLFTNDTTTIRLHDLVACSLVGPSVDDVAPECIERIKSFVKRRGNVRTIILDAQLRRQYASNASVYSEIHRRLQEGSLFQLRQNQEITVEWHVIAESIAQIDFLLKVEMPMHGVRASDSSAGDAIRQYLHTLYLSNTDVVDVSALASCQSLHMLDLSETDVNDVSALASCQSLHTLYLKGTMVNDVSVLASCKSLYKLNLCDTQVSDVSALASCQTLHALDLAFTRVSDVSALASCQSLHTLDLWSTHVSDVSALASSQSLREFFGAQEMVGVRDVQLMIQARNKQHKKKLDTAHLLSH